MQREESDIVQRRALYTEYFDKSTATAIIEQVPAPSAQPKRTRVKKKKQVVAPTEPVFEQKRVLVQHRPKRATTSSVPTTHSNTATSPADNKKSTQPINGKHKALTKHQKRKSGSDRSTASSKSTTPSFESRTSIRSSGSQSRIRALNFDGSITPSPVSISKPKSRGRYPASVPTKGQHQSVTPTDRYSRSSRSNTNDSKIRKSNSREGSNTFAESSTSTNGNQRPYDTKNNLANAPSTKRKTKMSYTQPEQPTDPFSYEVNQMPKGVDISDDAEQRSCCSPRKKLIWGSVICCILIAVSVVVPYLLLTGGSSGGGKGFPKLSNVKSDYVVAGITDDSCNESVPKSGTCTPVGLDETQQGGEFCNLVAKSMINTTIYGDIALINAGICQQGLLAPGITAGNIDEAIETQKLMVVQISGYDVVNVLNQALAATFGELGDNQAYPYAAGLRYRVQANLPDGDRLSTVEVNRGLRGDTWEPIDLRRFYKVITTEFLANGGMGYDAFGSVIYEWKDPLNILTVDAFYSYAMTGAADDPAWSAIPGSEYSTQYFIGENEEPKIAVVPERICHALVPGEPVGSTCTGMDVLHGGEVCNFVSWAVYDQNFGIDMVILKGDSCAGDIEEGEFVESSFDSILSGNPSLVSVDLLGSDIVALVNNGVSAVVDSSQTGNYPYAAGLRFDVGITSFPHVSNVQVLGSDGSWYPIVLTDTYKVVTISELASSSAAQDMGTTLKEEIINYAAEWRTLYKPPKDKVSTQIFE
mmetsp:Transcript_27706/g.61178  ORF Transcript_27706/g.61178 Transcript_27706/m.61178 type:complete len:757 (+) Transcript_27706:89-2359(+)